MSKYRLEELEVHCPTCRALKGKVYKAGQGQVSGICTRQRQERIALDGIDLGLRHYVALFREEWVVPRLRKVLAAHERGDHDRQDATGNEEKPPEDQ